jgi:hypothetical protein
MKAVYKYALALTEQQSLWMPAGAQILSVQMPNGMPMLWAAIDRAAAAIGKEER